MRVRELVIYSAMPDSLIIMLYIMSFKQKSNENIYSHLMLGLEILGYILYGAGNHIVKVDDDFHQMEELKVWAEGAHVAKSRVLFLAYY